MDRPRSDSDTTAEASVQPNVQDDSQEGLEESRIDILHGSEDFSDKSQCVRCHSSGGTAAFCVDCKEYLCKDCMQDHRHNRETWRHNLVQGKDASKQQPSVSKQQPLDLKLCTEHPGLPVKFYCQSDDLVGCKKCVANDHKTCSVRYISELASHSDNEINLTRLQGLTKQLIAETQSEARLIDEYSYLNDKCYERSVDKWTAFKAEVEASIAMTGEIIFTESEEVRDRNNGVLDACTDTLTEITQRNKSKLSEIDLQKKLKQMNKLRSTVIETGKRMRVDNEKLDCMDVHVQRYVLEKGPLVQQMLHDTTDIGKLKVWSSKLTPSGVYNVKTSYDRGFCRITGVVKISPTLMVVSDNIPANKCLKLIDIENNTIVYRRSLASHPRGITCIHGCSPRLAVAISVLHEIQLFATDDTLTPCGTVHVNGDCVKVASVGDKLVVSFKEPGKVEVIDLDGNVFRSIKANAKDNRVVGDPWGVCVSPDNKTIYVGDTDASTVTSLGADGTVNWRYKDKDLKAPEGLATGEDTCLYICCRSTHRLFELSPRGVRLRVISTEDFDIFFPRALYYDTQEGALYVSCSNKLDDGKSVVTRLSWQ